nr:unnamed protein product [Spirometra erinaceieuropaei]
MLIFILLIGNCICVTLCLPFMLGEVMHYVFAKPWHIAFLTGLALLPLAPCFLTFARMRIRREHKLQGNLAVDAACTNSCCFCCSACQIRDQIFFLREEKKWRLAFRTREPDRSPYVKPFVDMYGDFKKYRKRKQAEREKAAVRASVMTADLKETPSEGGSEDRSANKRKSDDASASSMPRRQARKPSTERRESRLEEKGASRSKPDDIAASPRRQRRASKPSPEPQKSRVEEGNVAEDMFFTSRRCNTASQFRLAATDQPRSSRAGKQRDRLRCRYVELDVNYTGTSSTVSDKSSRGSHYRCRCMLNASDVGLHVTSATGATLTAQLADVLR